MDNSMEQNKQRQPTARSSGSQAQQHLPNQNESNQQQMIPSPNQQQIIPSPTINAHSHSAFSAFMRGQQNQCMPKPPQPDPSQALQQQLLNFWAKQFGEIEEKTDFSNHSLPLARIKRIMKKDEEVKMISADACVIFAKACEIFIKELTLRSWVNAEENKRRTLQRNDIATAVTRSEVFEFLAETVPRDDTMEHDLYAGIQRGGGSARNMELGPNYYRMPPPPPPPRNVAAPSYGLPSMTMGRRVPNQARSRNRMTRPSGTRVWPHSQQPNRAPDSDDN
ncbi:nuclear transcription factor Y subunit C-2-like [Abrus precatorius]|uniref:Nuclear transcription factor Y subunit C-2-like n=1 Tax=Abrus precatorius TaxID=3816 RepID=A0A8B8KGS2_ABRPR|nr:nuclear transcription factor Y subunit C-2-like [Abrus precatorius]